MTIREIAVCCVLVSIIAIPFVVAHYSVQQIYYPELPVFEEPYQWTDVELEEYSWNIVEEIIIAERHYRYQIRHSPLRKGYKTYQHIKDPNECKKACHPPGYEGTWPDEFPEDVERVECKGTYCSKADKDDPESECKAAYGCAVFCSEICCVCLRECI